MSIDELITAVIDCAYTVRSKMPPGFIENVYRDSLMIELAKANIKAEKEKPINVYYDGQEVGFFKADIIVDDRLILELKAVNTLNEAHEIQLVNYLTATNIDDGLLINFGSEYKIKRKYRVFKRKIKE